MKKYKVLVFPAGTEIAFEIHNALKYSKIVELYGGNSVPSHAEFLFKNSVDGIPFVTDPAFLDTMNAAIDQYGIDFIYPAHDSACLELTRLQPQLHAKVVTSPWETVSICCSKNKTYEFLTGEAYIPEHYASAEDVPNYPVFIKPTVGQGSEGARKVDSKEALLSALSDGTEYAICQYLPGNEYTVDCFTDKNGVLRTVHLRQRERIRTGISVRSSLLPTDEKIDRIAQNINSHMVFNGAWFFQVKKTLSGDYKLMEISPRIPGTMAVSRNLGINYPLLTLYNMLSYDVDILDNGSEITLDRAFISRFKTDIQYSTVYVDFDDTVYLDNNVNVKLMSFLYQCANQGKKIVLLTKHAKDIYDSLAHYKIAPSLFDEIVHLAPDEKKWQHIQDTSAIFIDDSFAERKSVKENCHIPVFDLDMIECLLDWRM